MRDAFHEDLDRISDQLVHMTNLVSVALQRATQSLLEGNQQLAESVIAADDDIDALHREVDDLCVDLLAMQQPVATDLRMVVTAMHMSSDIERMGDLARHIAKMARRSAPASAVPENMHPIVKKMDEACQKLVQMTATAIQSKDIYAALAIEHEDDALDELHRDVFSALLKNWEHGIEAGVNMTLLSRYYERFGDHAVAVADRIVYLVTGRYGNPDEGLKRGE